MSDAMSQTSVVKLRGQSQWDLVGHARCNHGLTTILMCVTASSTQFCRLVLPEAVEIATDYPSSPPNFSNELLPHLLRRSF